MEIAQYEVLGNEAKRHVRPAGTIERSAFGLAHGSACQHSSIVPFLLRRPDYGGQAGTDSSLKTLTQHFVLGYFRQVPAGLIFSNHQRPSRALQLMRMCSCRSATKMCSKQFGYRLLVIGYLPASIFQKRDILLRQRNICAPEGIFQVSNILWPNQRENREGLI